MIDPYTQILSQITELALAEGTDPNLCVFILGPYLPPTDKDLLKSCSILLRKKYKITAFIEEEICSDYTIETIFRSLLRISALGTFVIPSDHESKGWIDELGQLLRQQPERIAVYYEKIEDIPFEIRNLMVGTPVRHGPLIYPNDRDRSVKDICTQIGTYFLKIKRH